MAAPVAALAPPAEATMNMLHIHYRFGDAFVGQQRSYGCGLRCKDNVAHATAQDNVAVLATAVWRPLLARSRILIDRLAALGRHDCCTQYEHGLKGCSAWCTLPGTSVTRYIAFCN